MTDENTKFYLDAIKHEIEQLAPRFTGNLEFKTNWKEGSLANMNVVHLKSIRSVKRNS